MTDYLPYDAFDDFYFGEILPKMHPATQEFATDLRVLRGESVKQSVQTLRSVYDKYYMYIPWFLDDIFPLDAETKLAIGKANMLLVMSYVTLDQTVDRQMPGDPVVPLVNQHLTLAAHEQFQSLYKGDHLFWRHYYHYLHLFFQSLALESKCLDQHLEPYTHEMMEIVCEGKALPFHITAYAMGYQLGNAAVCEKLCSVFNLLLLFDQIWDDAFDWEDDFKVGRCTLPILLALEGLGTAFENATLEMLQQEIEAKGILAHLIDVALHDLQEAKLMLEGIGLKDTKLYRSLVQREENSEVRRRSFETSAFLGDIIRLLSRSIPSTSS